MSKKKLAIIGSFPLPITGEAICNELIGHKLKNHYDILIINTALNKKIDKPGKFSFNKMFSQFRGYMKLGELLSCDIIYMTPGQTLLGIIRFLPYIYASIVFKKTSILHFHGSSIPNVIVNAPFALRLILIKTISRVKKVITLSNSIDTEFKEKLNINNTVVVNNYVSNEFVHQCKPKSRNKEVLKVLYLSNLIPEKGIFEVVEATKNLLGNNYSLQLEIAGSVPDDIEQQFYSAIQDQSCIQFHSIVTGKNKVDLYLSADVFVLPSYYPIEGVPLTILEAMAAGCIIISTTQGGIVDVVKHNENGFIVRKRNSEDIENAIINVIKMDEKDFNSVSLANQNKIMKEYSENHFLSEIQNVLELR